MGEIWEMEMEDGNEWKCSFVLKLVPPEKPMKIGSFFRDKP